MGFLDVANSTVLFVVGAIIALFVIIQSAFFLMRAWRQGRSLGIPAEKLKRAVRSSAIFTIVPTIPIVITLVTMVKGLGIPIPWIRLSVLGSASYELMAADTAAKSAGLAKGIADPGMNAAIFSAAVWVMTIGIIWGLLFTIFGLKKYLNSVNKVSSTDKKWGEIMVSCLFMGMIAAFLGYIVSPQIVSLFGSAASPTALIPITVLLTSAGFMGLFTWLAKKFKAMAWLDNFSMALAMVLSMSIAVLMNLAMGGV